MLTQEVGLSVAPQPHFQTWPLRRLRMGDLRADPVRGCPRGSEQRCRGGRGLASPKVLTTSRAWAGRCDDSGPLEQLGLRRAARGSLAVVSCAGLKQQGGLTTPTFPQGCGLCAHVCVCTRVPWDSRSRGIRAGWRSRCWNSSPAPGACCHRGPHRLHAEDTGRMPVLSTSEQQADLCHRAIPIVLSLAPGSAVQGHAGQPALSCPRC